MITSRFSIMNKVMKYISSYTRLFSRSDLWLLCKSSLDFMEDCIWEVLGILRQGTRLSLDVYDSFNSLIDEMKSEFVYNGSKFFETCVSNVLDEITFLQNKFTSSTISEKEIEEVLLLWTRYREMNLRLQSSPDSQHINQYK